MSAIRPTEVCSACHNFHLTMADSIQESYLISVCCNARCLVWENPFSIQTPNHLWTLHMNPSMGARAMAHQLKSALPVNWNCSLRTEQERTANRRRGKRAIGICLAWFLGLAGAAAAPLATNVTSSAITSARATGIPELGFREEALMVLVGTALIGLASAVRRVG
jgi:hypothetical protein